MPPVKERRIALLLMISTCRRTSARPNTAVISYYGYAQRDGKVHLRTSITASNAVKLLEAMGLD